MEPFSPLKRPPEAVKKPKKRSPRASRNRRSSARKSSPRMTTDPNEINLGRELGGRWRQLAAVLLRPGKEHVLRLLAERRARPDHPPEAAEYKEGEKFTGTDTFVHQRVQLEGFLTAYDMSTGKIAWQNESPESCYSGAVTTAGGLRLRRPEQRRTASLRQRNRRRTLELPDRRRRQHHGDPVRRRRRRENRHLRGRQLAGGDPARRKLLGLLAQRHDGTVEGTEAEGEGTEHAGEERPKTKPKKTKPTKKPKPAKAKKPKAKAAKAPTAGGAERRGRQGSLRRTMLDLPRRHRPRRQRRSRPDDDAESQKQAGAEEQVTNGGGGMPAFKGVLTEEEINNVAAYVVEDIVGGK